MQMTWGSTDVAKARSELQPRHLSKAPRHKAGCQTYRDQGPWPTEARRHGNPLSWKRAQKGRASGTLGPVQNGRRRPKHHKAPTQHAGG